MFWLAAAPVVVAGALLQSLTEGHRDGHQSVSRLGRSAPAQVFLGVTPGLECCWPTAVVPTLTVWAEVWPEVGTEVAQFLHAVGKVLSLDVGL